MPECAKTHLQQCGISKLFRGRTLGPAAFRARTPRGEEGMDREGKKGGEKEQGGGVDPCPPASKTVIRHCT